MCDCRSYNQPEKGGTEPEVVLDHARYFPDTGKPTVCVDPCISEVIERLWTHGIRTRHSCCGHNTQNPSVGLDQVDDFQRAVTLLRRDPRPWRVFVDIT